MMDITDDRAQHHSYINGPSLSHPARTVPIIQQPTLQSSVPSGDAMNVSLPCTALVPMGPPSILSPDNDANGIHDHMVGGDHPSSGSLALTTPSAAAAAAAGSGGNAGPKVVQTAFIHKLYK